ncbi:MAG TPA: hypothetical protein VH416_00130, partial [Gaiellaceae bacterium]
MTRTTRLAALAAGVVGALALASAAMASYTPRLAVSHKTVARAGNHPTTIHVTMPQSDDPTARIQIVVPTGYTVADSAPGATIGSGTGLVVARDQGLTLPLAGPVTTADPAAHAADACDPQPHVAVWVLALSVAGQSISIPIYVDQTSGAAAAIGSYTITVCFTAPDTPPGSPNRAPFGAQPLDANFTVSTMSLPASLRAAPWRAFFTPYTPGLGVPNVAGTVEARSFVGIPGAISLAAKYSRRTNVYRLGGQVTEGGAPVSGAKVRLYRGRSIKGLSQIGSQTVGASGAYGRKGRLVPRRTTYLQTRVTVPERDA